VVAPARQVGYEAARLLDDLMSGRPAPRDPVYLPPLGIVTRQSTDTLAIDDPAVAAALGFIRAHAVEEIHVSHVAAQAVSSRRMLEYKFRELVGRTILEEIRRVRLQRVKDLLRDTDLAMPAIARQSGFSTPQRMAVVFRQATGLTPSEYRRQTQNPRRVSGPRPMRAPGALRKTTQELRIRRFRAGRGSPILKLDGFTIALALRWLVAGYGVDTWSVVP